MSTTTGERIKERRTELGLSADSLAAKIGISRSTFFRYESGAIEKIPLENLISIANALNTTVKYLMDWEEKPTYVVLSPKAQKFAAAFDKATAKEQQIIQLMLSEYLDDEKASWDFTEALPIP